MGEVGEQESSSYLEREEPQDAEREALTPLPPPLKPQGPRTTEASLPLTSPFQSRPACDSEQKVTDQETEIVVVYGLVSMVLGKQAVTV